MPPTPMNPSTIDSLAGAGLLGFSSVVRLCTRHAPRPASAAAPSAEAASISRRVHVSMPRSPVSMISVNKRW